tara:strand:+ start:1723 stop:1866 length:144 start_codon:yes stop_codon:yes gene_type:complete
MGKANARNKARRLKLTQLSLLHKKWRRADDDQKQEIKMKINSIKSKI